MGTRLVITPSIRRLVGDQPSMELAPDFVDVVDLPNGPRRVRQGWLCEAVAHDGPELWASLSASLENCTERDAWDKAAAFATTLRLRADLYDDIQNGGRIIEDWQVRSEVKNWRQAVDAVDCNSARRVARRVNGKLLYEYVSDPRVAAFRAADHGENRQRATRDDDVRVRLSPWLRPAPDPTLTSEYFERVIGERRKLARAFPELPWPPELR